MMEQTLETGNSCVVTSIVYDDEMESGICDHVNVNHSDVDVDVGKGVVVSVCTCCSYSSSFCCNNRTCQCYHQQRIRTRINSSKSKRIKKNPVLWKKEWGKCWKVNYIKQMLRQQHNYKFNCLVILILTFILIFNHHPVNCQPFERIIPTTHTTTSHTSHSQYSECDWNGRGTTTITNKSSTLASLVQTVILRCTRGTIHWEQPKGGLKVTITPNVAGTPYKLCLENSGGKRRHRILLEETDTESKSIYSSAAEEQNTNIQRRLLPILTTSNSNCYRIQNPSAVLYIESHGEIITTGTTANPSIWNYSKGDEYLNEIDDVSDNSPANNINAILIAYEVESLRGDGDPCRPCSESEVLQTFCSSDVVARGSILQVQPGKKYDSIYVKADLVLHQNQPVFSPFKNLYKFLQQKSIRFDMDKPQRFSLTKNRSQKQNYGGIVSHPSTCSSSVGPGDFLWLIKFRFGIPLIDCVIYWDKWVDIARTRIGECPLKID